MNSVLRDPDEESRDQKHPFAYNSPDQICQPDDASSLNLSWNENNEPNHEVDTADLRLLQVSVLYIPI